MATSFGTSRAPDLAGRPTTDDNACGEHTRHHASRSVDRGVGDQGVALEYYLDLVRPVR